MNKRFNFLLIISMILADLDRGQSAPVSAIQQIEKPKKIKLPKTTESPVQHMMHQIKDLNKLPGDLMHGDYPGALLDGIDLLETMKLPFLLKLSLPIVGKLVSVFHKVYLKLFPKARNDGNFVDNLMVTMTRGGSMLGGAMKLLSAFSG